MMCCSLEMESKHNTWKHEGLVTADKTTILLLSATGFRLSVSFTLTTPQGYMAVQYLEKLSVDGWGILAAGCVQNQVPL